MTARNTAEPPRCPCGRADARGRPLRCDACCGRWIDAPLEPGAGAPDAESLMRSRYTAFVLGRTGYLLATWHPTTRPRELRLEPRARWLGLEVRAHRPIDAQHATVEFVARFALDGRAVRQHESSRFVRDNGRWYYVDGDAL